MVGDDGFEMPSYGVRRSIAAKVLSKKSKKGYVLSDENCLHCEMPLMTIDGSRNECKTCPAIKKWVKRQLEACKATEEDEGRLEMREQEDSSNDRLDGSGLEEFREECGDNVIVEHIYDNENYEEQLGDEDPAALNRDYLHCTSAEEERAIRLRAKQIIMDARGHGVDEDVDMGKDGGVTKRYSWEDDYVNPAGCSPMLDNATYSMDDVDKAIIEERVDEIINRARQNLNADHNLDLPPEMILSPRQKSIDKVSSKLDHDEAETEALLGTWEASVVIQSVARRYLARKIVTEMSGTNGPPVEDTGPTQFSSLGLNKPTADDEAEGRMGSTSNDDDFKTAPPKASATSKETMAGTRVHEEEEANTLPKTARRLPKRSLIAEVACKFDDAVTEAFVKMTTYVQCTDGLSGEDYGQQFGQGDGFVQQSHFENTQFQYPPKETESNTATSTAARVKEKETTSNSEDSPKPLMTVPKLAGSGDGNVKEESVNQPASIINEVEHETPAPDNRVEPERQRPSESIHYGHASPSIGVNTRYNNNVATVNNHRQFDEHNQGCAPTREDVQAAIQAAYTKPQASGTGSGFAVNDTQQYAAENHAHKRNFDPREDAAPSPPAQGRNDPFAGPAPARFAQAHYQMIHQPAMPPAGRSSTFKTYSDDPNVNRQLAYAEKSIEDAKRFIMSRNLAPAGDVIGRSTEEILAEARAATAPCSQINSNFTPGGGGSTQQYSRGTPWTNAPHQIRPSPTSSVAYDQQSVHRTPHTPDRIFFAD